MNKLTGIFKIHERIGSVVEIVKKIGDKQAVIPVSRNEIKVEKDGSIYVSEKVINSQKWFFKSAKVF